MGPRYAYEIKRNYANPAHILKCVITDARNPTTNGPGIIASTHKEEHAKIIVQALNKLQEVGNEQS